MSLLNNLGMDADTIGLLGMSLMNRGNKSNPQLKQMMMSDLLNNNGSGLLNTTQNNNSSNGTNIDIKVPPLEDSVPRLAWSIGQLESGGNYNSLGPPTNGGDRAYGRYQVMGNNIPSWTKIALGQSMTPQQFLSNPQAQDAVANHFLGQYYNKYGNINDAASMWFSGRPANGNNSKDVLGTSVPAYIRTVNKYYYGS
jgi:hypothetical protein